MSSVKKTRENGKVLSFERTIDIRVLDTIDQWFPDHDKGKITVTMYDILIICGIITVILTLGEYGALCMLDVYGAILLITFQNMS